MDALVSQINPHFLFNTLNTISSLIRFDPDTARSVLVKLSNILRRRLKSLIHFLPLKEEIDFIDDYLDIEVVRFGRDKLQIHKEVEPDTLELSHRNPPSKALRWVTLSLSDGLTAWVTFLNGLKAPY
jgi:two-component system LytT family sensor kinase